MLGSFWNWIFFQTRSGPTLLMIAWLLGMRTVYRLYYDCFVFLLGCSRHQNLRKVQHWPFCDFLTLILFKVKLPCQCSNSREYLDLFKTLQGCLPHQYLGCCWPLKIGQGDLVSIISLRNAWILSKLGIFSTSISQTSLIGTFMTFQTRSSSPYLVSMTTTHFMECLHPLEIIGIFSSILMLTFQTRSWSTYLVSTGKSQSSYLLSTITLGIFGSFWNFTEVFSISIYIRHSILTIN